MLIILQKKTEPDNKPTILHVIYANTIPISTIHSSNLPMAEISTQRKKSISSENILKNPTDCNPKQSTIAFIRQFARIYNAVTDMRGPIADLIPN